MFQRKVEANQTLVFHPDVSRDKFCGKSTALRVAGNRSIKLLILEIFVEVRWDKTFDIEIFVERTGKLLVLEDLCGGTLDKTLIIENLCGGPLDKTFDIENLCGTYIGKTSGIEKSLGMLDKTSEYWKSL